MISANQSENIEGLMMNSGEEKGSANERKSRSSSSSSSASSSGYPFELGDADSSRLMTGEDASPNFDSEGNGIPLSSMPGHEPSPTQSPPTQMMEPYADTTHSPYRIPSSVFARTKSTALAEWSVTSDESLFSIRMGNTSFARDQYGWFGKSGELGLHAVDPSLLSPPLIDFSSNQPPSVQAQQLQLQQQQITKPSELAPQNPAVGAAESKAAETMMEVIRENEDEACKKKLHTEKSIRSSSFRRSDASSGASVKSFAFPILTGDNKDSQKKIPTSRLSSQPQTPKAVQEPEPPKKPLPEANTMGILGRWFSCSMCCSNCS